MPRQRTSRKPDFCLPRHPVSTPASLHRFTVTGTTIARCGCFETVIFMNKKNQCCVKKPSLPKDQFWLYKDTREQREIWYEEATKSFAIFEAGQGGFLGNGKPFYIRYEGKLSNGWKKQYSTDNGNRILTFPISAPHPPFPTDLPEAAWASHVLPPAITLAPAGYKENMRIEETTGQTHRFFWPDGTHLTPLRSLRTVQTPQDELFWHGQIQGHPIYWSATGSGSSTDPQRTDYWVYAVGAKFMVNSPHPLHQKPLARWTYLGKNPASDHQWARLAEAGSDLLPRNLPSGKRNPLAVTTLPQAVTEPPIPQAGQQRLYQGQAECKSCHEGYPNNGTYFLEGYCTVGNKCCQEVALALKKGLVTRGANSSAVQQVKTTQFKKPALPPKKSALPVRANANQNRASGSGPNWFQS